ncbi:hypothetical protein A8B98_12195 [Hymenobacter sp. UV11]|nr:hypothetical protein A8B98_12195 [Hymenobacter sp. UV11]
MSSYLIKYTRHEVLTAQFIAIYIRNPQNKMRQSTINYESLGGQFVRPIHTNRIYQLLFSVRALLTVKDIICR